MANQKKLLEGLSGPGINVTVRSLAKYMASNGIRAKATVGRLRVYIGLNEKAYGVDLGGMDETGASFYKERAYAGHLNFIPPEDEAMLNRLEKRLRRAVEHRTLADGFMPMSAYTSLKNEYETTRIEYFQKRDEILAKWPSLLTSFEAGARQMLAGINMPDYQRSQLLEEFMRGIPSASKYKESFSMALEVHAFPAECELEGLDSSVAADVQATWQDEVVTTAITSIEKLIGCVWSKALTAMRQHVSRGTIKAATVKSLARTGEDLAWKNVFRNPLITQLRERLRNLEEKDDETQAVLIEAAVVDIFAYAMESKLDLSFKDSPYTDDQLSIMLDYRNRKGA